MVKKNSVFEEGFAETNGIKLHYIAQGKGDLAILLHGFPEYWYSWRHQIPYLAQNYRVAAPDLRGYNTSDKPAGVQAYHISELVKDVKGLIKFFGAEKAVIISHDWGGVIAWDLAAFFPEVVEKLVIMNAPHPKAFLRELVKNPRQMLSSWYIFMMQIPGLAEWYVRRNDYRQIGRVFAGWAHRKDTFSAEDIRKFKDAIGRPGSLTAAISYYRALFRDRNGLKRVKNFPKIKVPTLLIWAENDKALTKNLTYKLDQYFEAPLEIRYIPDCSHWVQQEQPELVNKYMGEFLLQKRNADGTAKKEVRPLLRPKRSR